MRHVFETMGTVASLEVRDDSGTEPPLAELQAGFDSLESVFSLYRDDTELGRIAAGTRRLTDASAEVLDVYARAIEWRRLTEGAFTPHRPDGVVDLDGIVKAIAIEQAGFLLTGAGFENWSLNVGGDILLAGEPWVLGIVDPADRSVLLGSVRLLGSRRALATSGTTERGQHVWSKTDTVTDLQQVSVIADDIVTADVLATAILAGGTAFRDVATERWSVDVCTVDHAGGIAATPGFRESFASVR